MEKFSDEILNDPNPPERTRYLTGAELPIVLVSGAVVSRGGKISEPRIAEALRAAGATGVEGARS